MQGLKSTTADLKNFVPQLEGLKATIQNTTNDARDMVLAAATAAGQLENIERQMLGNVQGREEVLKEREKKLIESLNIFGGISIREAKVAGREEAVAERERKLSQREEAIEEEERKVNGYLDMIRLYAIDRIEKNKEILKNKEEILQLKRERRTLQEMNKISMQDQANMIRVKKEKMQEVQKERDEAIEKAQKERDEALKEAETTSLCCICYEEQIEFVLMNCMHIFCGICIIYIKEKSVDKNTVVCPRCRKKSTYKKRGRSEIRRVIL